MSSPSIKSRFIVSIIANILKGGLAFATVAVVARGLEPELFGDYIFLLTSITGILFLIDLGTSKAFFTFISQKPRGFIFIIFYTIWQALQFIVSILTIGLILPDNWLAIVWLGQDRELVVLAFVAVFLRQAAWGTIVSIGESQRMTYRLQWMNVCLSGVLLILITGAWLAEVLTIRIIFILTALEYLLALGIACKLFSVHRLQGEAFHWRSTLNQYRTYCVPLVFISVFGFGHQFAERWFLQNFGGSIEQGFFGIAYQLSVVCLIGATSVVNIFWKEVAEAHKNKDFERAHNLFQKVSRILYFWAATLSGFLIQWGEEIIQIFFGESYKAATVTLAIMFLFPVHQSLAYIADTLFLAMEKTKVQLFLRCAFWGIGIPATYLVVGPEDAFISGLELGSVGIALKLVILQIINVNIMVWWISREFKWKFDWAYQVIGLSAALFFGWIAHEVVMGINSIFMMNLFLTFGIALLLYSLMIWMFLWFFPWVAGLSREEILSNFLRLRGLVLRKSGESAP